MDTIYEVHGLTKRYGRTAALNGVDFAVTPGKLVGLLGPNGSGKTTLMKISAALMLSTHLIGDIEKVLDEVILLQDGKVLRQAAVDELREETGESVDAYFREVYKC